MQQLLPDLPSHPKGRIAIAHMYSVLEGVFGCPINDVRDCRLDDALAILKYTMDNASRLQIMTPLRQTYQPEPKDNPPKTLEHFFE
jgi:hypothetical protein